MEGANNNIVLQLLKQYDMLASSLILIDDSRQRENVYYELNKVETRIIDETNKSYEKDYNILNDKIVTDIDEEKERLISIIELINNRKKYLEEKRNKHRMLTGLFIEIPNYLGKDAIIDFEHKIEIIDKYEENLELIKKYSNEITSLKDKLSLANEKNNISNALNNELEVKIKKMFDDNFNKLNLFKMKESKDEIEKVYSELQYILSIAEENIKITNTLSYNVDFDEQKQYEEVEELYLKYKEKIAVLKLIDIYDKKTKSYDELMDKRKKINDIMDEIPNSSLYIALIGELKEQFETLRKEQEDINTLKSLEDEIEKKENLVLQIKTENNSEIFQDILKELVSKEEKLREEKLLSQKKSDEEKRKKLLEEEEKRQEEIKKRQKLIEDMRKKDMEERAKKLLEEKQKSIIQTSQNDNIDSIESNNNDFINESVSKKEQDSDKVFESSFFQDIKHELELENNNIGYDNLVNNSLKENDDFIIDGDKELEVDEKSDLVIDRNADLGEKNEKIMNALPKDLDEYIKKFDETDSDIFKEDQIFIDY